jgi:hypothetical protein
MEGAATGTVRAVLRLEGLALLIAASFAYSQVGDGWLVYALCFFLPDLSFLGYVAGSRAGAIAYNAAHSTIGAIAVLGMALAFPQAVPLAVGLIWLAHIGFDRMIGYGLKYALGAGFTHLGRVGRDARRAALSTPEQSAE